MKPISKQQAKKMTADLLENMRTGGWWAKNCAACGRNIGGRLAEYGKPHPDDLKYCACPECGSVGQVNIEYIPPEDE